jgi:hypothetical protein
MTRRPFAAFLLLLGCGAITTAASAQVFYEPVTYQYRTGDVTYYYGGHNPRIFDHVANDVARTSYTSVIAGGQQPQHVLDRLRVYSDAIPFTNLADSSYTTYGSWTAADARNEANNNAARYFRKRDLLRAAVVTEEGTFVVPAHLQASRIETGMPRSLGGAAAGDLPKGTILIIPKKLLEPPVKKDPPALMTSAQQ